MQGKFDIPSLRPDVPLASGLCVTERRGAFVPWLLWNFRKQDHPARELVVVDGDPPGTTEWPPDVTVVHCEAGASVGRKRNIALEAARGEILAFFDDDDWQHPRRLSLLAEALVGPTALAGATRGWFVDVATGRARAHDAQRGVIFNGLGVRRSALGDVRFDEGRPRAADTGWLAALRREVGRPPAPLPHLLSFWLCHRDNVSNPARRYAFPHGLGAVRAAAGADAWGDTDGQLAHLRERLRRR